MCVLALLLALCTPLPHTSTSADSQFLSNSRDLSRSFSSKSGDDVDDGVGVAKRDSGVSLDFLYVFTSGDEVTWYYKLQAEGVEGVPHSLFLEVCNTYLGDPTVRCIKFEQN